MSEEEMERKINAEMSGTMIKSPQPAWLPASLMFALAFLAFGGCQVYAVLIGGWKWSLVGLVALFAVSMAGIVLQSYANRRKNVQR